MYATEWYFYHPIDMNPTSVSFILYSPKSPNIYFAEFPYGIVNAFRVQVLIDNMDNLQSTAILAQIHACSWWVVVFIGKGTFYHHFGAAWFCCNCESCGIALRLGRNIKQDSQFAVSRVIRFNGDSGRFWSIFQWGNTSGAIWILKLGHRAFK